MVQLGFLRLLSVQARQNLTYHCHRSVAWVDRSAKNNYKRALHFRAANEEELSYETNPYIKALTDGCSVSSQLLAPPTLSFKAPLMCWCLCLCSTVKASTGRSWRSTRHRWSIFLCWTSRCQTLGRATSSLGLKWDLCVSRVKHTHT